MVDCVGENDSTHYHYAAPGRYTGQPSLITQPQLCHNCNKNQASKIQELNSFEPSRETSFQNLMLIKITWTRDTNYVIPVITLFNIT